MALAIGLFALLAYLVASGSAASAIAAAKAHTGWLSDLLQLVQPITSAIDAAFVSLAKWLSHHLGSLAAALEGQVQRWFGQLVHYQYVVGYWSLLWPVRLYQFGEHLFRHSIPVAVNARTKPLAKRIDATEAQAKASAGFAHSLPKVIKGNTKVVEVTQIQRVAMPHAGEWEWVHDHFDALKKAVATVAEGVIPLRLPHAPAWPHPWRGIRTELGKLWKFRNYVLGAAGAAAIVATAIGGITPRCVKSGGLGKFARRLCGIGPQALEDFLGLLVDLFTFSYICEAVKLMEDAFNLVVPGLSAFLTDITAQIDHCKYVRPVNHTVADPALPPTTGLTLNPS